MRRLHTLRGFTLIELIVSVALFTVVMLIAIGALVGMAGADRKAQSLQSIIDNLNFALDDMSRSVRTGTTYHCDSTGAMTDLATPSPDSACASGGSSYLSFESSRGNTSIDTDQVVYAYSASCEGYAGGCIEKSTDSGVSFLPITSPDIFIDDVKFYVVGAAPWPGNTVQPKATVTITAHINLSGGSTTSLHLQTTLTQRVYDE